MTTPPIQYFVRCDASTPGAQRVGFDFFTFSHPDSLSDMMNNAVFDRMDSSVSGEIEALENDVHSKNIRIQELSEEVVELERKIEGMEKK